MSTHATTTRYTLALTMVLATVLSGAWAEEKPAPKPKEDPALEAQRLLAEKERAKGVARFGKDPAFLVFPRPLERKELGKDLMTEDVHAMIAKALDFLSRTQDADGGWTDEQWPSNTGVAALCSLAFMAEGSQPKVGKYGGQIDRAMEFLLKNAQAGGAIAGKGSNAFGPMYEHAFSTLALLMAQGDMPWRPQTKDILDRAVQAILNAQKLDGGWRYDLGNLGHSDMSVTANVIWVLRMAKKNGFTVDGAKITRGVKFIESCAFPDGTFRYRKWGAHAEPSLGGIGIMAMASDGSLKHELIPRARERIAYDYRRYTVDDLRARNYFVYQGFYASLAMYTVGDEHWVPFYKKAVQVLKAAQKPDGEFVDEHGNNVYPTAMAVMILQAPLGYMPLYER